MEPQQADCEVPSTTQPPVLTRLKELGLGLMGAQKELRELELRLGSVLSPEANNEGKEAGESPQPTSLVDKIYGLIRIADCLRRDMQKLRKRLEI